MVIYAEYLFIENGIAGLIILSLTGRICGVKITKKMLALGSALCGLYAFVLFWEGIYWWAALLLKAAFSVGLILLAFPFGGVKKMMKALLIFYIISFALGGIIIASLYLSGGTGVTSGGAFYIGRITYIRVFSGMLISWILLYAFTALIKERLRKGRDEAQLCFTIGTRSVKLNGLIDTGNFLRDPISGRPVCIVAEDAVKGLFVGETQFCIIPYRSVDNREGVLSGIRLDGAELIIKGKTKYVNIVLAVSKARGPMGGDGEKYDVILHEALAEGGVFSDE